MLTVLADALKRWVAKSPPPQTTLPSSAKRETDTHMNKYCLESEIELNRKRKRETFSNTNRRNHLIAL